MLKRLFAMGVSFLFVLATQFQTHAQIWPNEPAGSTLITEWDLSGDSDGWLISSSGAKVVDDATAPQSASKVGQFTYPVGFRGGSGPARICRSLPDDFSNEGYVGFWWKPSNPWQGHIHNINKIFFLLGYGGNIIPIMYGPPGGPYQLRIAPQWGDWTWLYPNVGDGTISLGQWHRIEFYFKRAAPNGIIRWWMNGRLVGNYENLSFPSTPAKMFEEAQFAPTWGGGDDVKTQTDYFWYDHIRISQPHGAPPIPVYISTGQLPAARSGSPYSANLQAQGGNSPYAWTVVSGSLLPGLSLSKTGVISGTPTTGGRCDFTVKVVDSNVPAQEASKAITIVASGATSVPRGSPAVRDNPIKMISKNGGIALQAPQQKAFSVRIYNLSGREIFNSGLRQERETVIRLEKGIYVARCSQGPTEGISRICVLK